MEFTAKQGIGYKGKLGNKAYLAKITGTDSEARKVSASEAEELAREMD